MNSKPVSSPISHLPPSKVRNIRLTAGVICLAISLTILMVVTNLTIEPYKAINAPASEQQTALATVQRNYTTVERKGRLGINSVRKLEVNIPTSASSGVGTTITLPSVHANDPRLSGLSPGSTFEVVYLKDNPEFTAYPKIFNSQAEYEKAVRSDTPSLLLPILAISIPVTLAVGFYFLLFVIRPGLEKNKQHAKLAAVGCLVVGLVLFYIIGKPLITALI